MVQPPRVPLGSVEEKQQKTNDNLRLSVWADSFLSEALPLGLKKRRGCVGRVIKRMIIFGIGGYVRLILRHFSIYPFFFLCIPKIKGFCFLRRRRR